MTDAFVRVDDLRVSFPTEDGIVRAVDGVTFSVERGKTLAIVGESGSGKSVTSQALMGLVNRRTATIEGRAWVGDNELIAASDDELRKLRGSVVSMIFQDPFASLHPFYRIGNQLVEAVLVHQDVSKSEARAQALDMLQRVGIPNAERRIDDYPHQLSGGMRQRVMIAMALAGEPDLLIADEPTTALDVTIQAQILELLFSIRKERSMSMLLVTHDLGVVAEQADDVCVVYAGEVVERAKTKQLFVAPRHPYSRGLLASLPSASRGVVQARLPSIPGTVPSAARLPVGCYFASRCSRADEVCEAHPSLVALDGAAVRCFHPESTP